MSARIVFATAIRVLRQLRHDPRTVALLLLVPSGLLVLLYFVLHEQGGFERVGVPLLGLFPLITMFLTASIAMLRERTTGTLERLMTLPLAKLDVLAGYALAFSALAIVQSGVVSTIGFAVLGLDAEQPVWLVILLALGNGLLGMAFGLFTSAFAASEFQAVQFLPAFVLPQLLLCGLFVPRERMVEFLEVGSYALPVTYAFDALLASAQEETLGGSFALDVAVIAGATLLALALGAATLPRRTA